MSLRSSVRVRLSKFAWRFDHLFSSNSEEFIAVCGDLNAEAYETPARLLRGTPDEGDDALASGQLKSLDEHLRSGAASA